MAFSRGKAVGEPKSALLNKHTSFLLGNEGGYKEVEQGRHSSK